ncbi:3'(2'),5'-bisphosphate nucleotidase CysQ [Deinococcus deserti]|uniref:Putative Inositol monophosphatase family protein n=1 Tax=Deinococcus deserti (strain DSM 17065 / CIP 109153 / LMG 22923 / VCD115) TaxID=546414 RepID=C1CVJ1_DEIDV|nr:3'(2'),5'-bisphosphate nucleotidase CysQ [Deinococcus deserti]ACO46208.1 putative Inositol monophosphatase family protein [Deinococcus deserti VCD115]
MTDLPSASGLAAELQLAVRLAREAGELLRTHLHAGLTVEHKTSADDPVTAADREASTLIIRSLRESYPEDGLLSEEEIDAPERLTRQRVWIVDPIDGTKEFTSGSPDYCVSIGLSIDEQPVLGVVYAPATDELFSGVVGQGVQKNGQAAGFSDRDAYVVSVSDTEFSRELHRHDLPGMAPSGSIALKLARIAAGEADVTFTISPRSEWDIAAGHALLRASGGDLRRRDGRPVAYNTARPHIEQGLMGGRLEAMNWLDTELASRALPTAHLGLGPQDPAWTVLSDLDREQLGMHSGVCVRHAAGQLLALVVVDPHTGLVQRAEGDAFHLERLTRDVTRGQSTLKAGVPGEA